MHNRRFILIDAPVDCGKTQRGCALGPDALRAAGLVKALHWLGALVEDTGALTPPPFAPEDPSDSVHARNETAAWTRVVSEATEQAATRGVPIVLGGDHALSMGSVAGMARYAARMKRPLYVLWLDAHSDFHTPHTTTSGHLHGCPLAYVTGRPGFDGFPPVPHPVPLHNICMFGLRSVDPAERAALHTTPVRQLHLRDTDETGIAAPLSAFLDTVRATNGLLHVSLDVDVLDPRLAPGVGTPVTGGLSLHAAHLVMDMLRDSGLISALDLVELNPFLDDHGRTAQLLVDLATSLLGLPELRQPTRAIA